MSPYTGKLQVPHEFFVEVLTSSIRVKGFYGWSPDITVDLPTDFLGAFTLTNFWYGLAGSLGIYARFAESRFGW
jgi:hypothetical protein